MAKLPKRVLDVRAKTHALLTQRLQDLPFEIPQILLPQIAAVVEHAVFSVAPETFNRSVYTQMAREVLAAVRARVAPPGTDTDTGTDWMEFACALSSAALAPPVFFDEEQIRQQRLRAAQGGANVSHRKCTRCQGMVVTFEMQLRSADEAGSVVYQCVNPQCGHTHVIR